MSITELMADLANLGIEIRAVGERIRFRPREAMTPELAERVRVCRDDLLALLRQGESRTPSLDEFLQTVIDTFDGEVVDEVGETAPLLPETPLPGEAPRRGCYSCGERQFHRIRGGAEWVCSRCHPPGTEQEVVETWTAPHTSPIQAMRERTARVELLKIRGLGKRRTRPGRSSASWEAHHE